MIVWQESIAEILNMQQEIRENVLKLTSANKLLVTERESKYRLARRRKTCASWSF